MKFATYAALLSLNLVAAQEPIINDMVVPQTELSEEANKLTTVASAQKMVDFETKSYDYDINKR
jgi:hypothetical protein